MDGRSDYVLMPTRPMHVAGEKRCDQNGMWQPR